MVNPSTFVEQYLSQYGYDQNPALANYFKSIGHVRPQYPLLDQSMNLQGSNVQPQMDPDMQQFQIGGQHDSLYPKRPPQPAPFPEDENPALYDKARVDAEMADARNGGPGGEAGAIDPIQRGVASAMEARKQRLGMDDEQKRQALGQALIGFFSNYANSNKESGLDRINESFNPALAAWNAEKQRAHALNKSEHEAEHDIKKMEQHERLKQQELALDQQRVNILQKEYERKLNANAFKEMSPKDQSVIKGGLHKRYLDLLSEKRIEYKQSTEHIKGTSDAAEAKRAKARAEVDARWADAEANIRKDMDQFGLDYGDIMPKSEVKEAVKPENAGKMVIDGIEVTEDNFASLPPNIQQKALVKADAANKGK